MPKAITRRILPILCGLLLGACGASASQSPAAALSVSASEFRFTPATLVLTAGQPTTLTFKNVGQTLHDFTIVSGPGIPTPVPQAGSAPTTDAGPYHVAAQAGQQATLTLTLPAGSYTFICSVQGHKDLGMTGTITVS